jgi:hypothetical protein
MLIERAGIGVLLEDVQGHSLGAVPPDRVEQQRPCPLTADVRPQVKIFEHVAVKCGVADDLGLAHRHPDAAGPEHDVPDPVGDLLVTAFLRRQVRHGRGTGGEVDACDRCRIRHVREPDLGPAAIAHGKNLPGRRETLERITS